MLTPTYMDYSATTPVDKRVAEKMAKYLTLEGDFGNPASRSHYYGWQAEKAVDEDPIPETAEPSAEVVESKALESVEAFRAQLAGSRSGARRKDVVEFDHHQHEHQLVVNLADSAGD